jgi:hypothetical protein
MIAALLIAVIGLMVALLAIGWGVHHPMRRHDRAAGAGRRGAKLLARPTGDRRGPLIVAAARASR